MVEKINTITLTSNSPLFTFQEKEKNMLVERIRGDYTFG